MLAEYSIWLLPMSAQESTLAATVTRLSNALAGAVFAPHVTIQGDLTQPLEKLAEFSAALAERVVVQNWRVRRVENSPHLFRCLYLRFGVAPGFEALQEASRAFSKTTDGLSPFPHLSLAYGNAGPAHAQARADLAREFMAREIVFDRLAICRSSKNVPVADWQCLAMYPLKRREQDRGQLP